MDMLIDMFSCRATATSQSPITPITLSMAPATPVSHSPAVTQSPVMPVPVSHNYAKPVTPFSVSQNLPVTQSPVTPVPVSQSPAMQSTLITQSPVIPMSRGPVTPIAHVPVAQSPENFVTQFQVSQKPAVNQSTPLYDSEDDWWRDDWSASYEEQPMTADSSSQKQNVQVWNDKQQQGLGVERTSDGQQRQWDLGFVDLSRSSTPVELDSTPARVQPPVLKPIANHPYVTPSHHRPPRPIQASTSALPSSCIEPWVGQKTIHKVIEANHKLSKVSKVSTLAVKIAREAVFGETVMKKCTAMGSRDLPGLPRKELFEIKKALFDLFPSYWSSCEEFESVWATCIESIGQACKRLRLKKPTN